MRSSPRVSLALVGILAWPMGRPKGRWPLPDEIVCTAMGTFVREGGVLVPSEFEVISQYYAGGHMAQQYRAIVIGCGAVGAATAYWLSRRLGGGVLALEQYQHGHSRGASEDHSRVIRHAYRRPEYTAS